MEFRQGLGYEKHCRLTNTTQSEVVPSLPLPSLPACCGSADRVLPLSDEPAHRGAPAVERPDVLDHASVIAGLLRDCDVSYLNIKDDARAVPDSSEEHSRLYYEVLKYNPEAFQCSNTGFVHENSFHSPVAERNPSEQNARPPQREHRVLPPGPLEKNVVHEPTTSSSARKPKHKRKDIDSTPLSAGSDLPDHQGLIYSFCEMVEDFCGRAELTDDGNGSEVSLLPLADIKLLVNEIMSIRAKKVLQLIPLNILLRLINVLDRQIQWGQGLSLDGNEYPDSDAISSVFCALESTHAALAIMTHEDMPKQLYKEEVIERLLDVTRNQIMESMAACNPTFRALYKPCENGSVDGDEDEDDDLDNGSAAKKRRNTRTANVRKSTGNKVSAAVSSVIQKLCSILGFLKDLLSVERLTDSCILQLVKTSFSTFLVDNVQLLQLKSINLICGVFALYTQHRNFLIDETLQLLWKLQFSKRALRSYHLPDEEQKQIQMVTALLIQLVQFSANLPETLKSTPTWNTIIDASIEASYPIKCHEGATEACCLFWTSVLQRFTNAKAHDISEAKVILENLVMDLLTTLNLPEYPASAPILEVLCVLLLQNAGLKSKDVSARALAIDLLGTIAARLKLDAVTCNRDKLWILQELSDENSKAPSDMKDVCSVCLNGRGANLVCQSCQRCFHADCMRVAGQELTLCDWSCHICLCEKQLVVLQSYCKSQCKDQDKRTTGAAKKASGALETITHLEVTQQILLNYLQETGSQDDANLFTRWFHLCLWYKDGPLCQERIIYYLARLKSKTILRDSGAALLLSRDWAKKICTVLGQNNSFSRGFDKILSLLLATLRENSPVLRAKALRAVSSIVEVDPEVLCDKRVQCAVEGRFCDSAISVREAALELVGRHIASHPDVGLKYFEKVAERIKDTGVSVRKRAIKIIRDLCISNPAFPEATNAFIEIISRVSDEESSVQDLVCKTFYEFWFEEPSGNPTQYVGDVRKRCELICKRLLERILQVEEGSDEDDDAHALPYVLALHAFCVVDPLLCAPTADPSQFVVTLQPYLKNQVDNKATAQLLESIIFIIDSVLPLLRKPPLNVIEELEQDLKHMIVRHSFLTVVHSCIKCLCSLSKIAGKGASLVDYLIKIFSKHLHGPSPDNRQLLGRSLFCLGLLIRYGNDLLIARIHEPHHAVKSLRLLKEYLHMEDFGLKVRALQALGHILIARPECMLEKDIGSILEASLSADADARVKMQVLQNLYEYLIDAESQLNKDGVNKTATEHPEDVSNTVPVAAGAGDTNICGGIIQLYWNNILDRCLDVNDQVRQFGLKIVEIVLRQGLVHPITCVPCLVALETDPMEVNSKLAHHLLINMNEKYPAFFENRLGDGLQMSFRFIQSMGGNHNDVSGHAKGKSDNNRLAFSRKFESSGGSYSSLPFLIYCTEILASLPFSSPDEPLYLIYDINRVVQLRAGAIESSIKMWISSSQQRDSVKASHESHMGNDFFQQVSDHNLSDSTLTTSDNSCGISKEDLQKSQADFHDAVALQLLLKLKRHLKVVYSLNDARCQAFSLKEHPKGAEAISRQNIPFNISEVSISLPTSYQEMVEKYQEFKTALKEDTMDYTTYTSNIKRKRPTPRSSRAGRAALDGYDDDDNDEDWTSGARRLNFSGQKRVTRQRL
ncbi:hypothetical protein J5N97_008442 [Dioscorea zingiberensis]|uniref:Sister chromatid cohesion protein n=1 Tax=Dioscorea zingiberensis TaxID=325984 RepID=A0A9D5CWZ1_9LILI|nr:hypothetical protein J5N97_008442 [Dioscorea zingiberensis]